MGSVEWCYFLVVHLDKATFKYTQLMYALALHGFVFN